jgi:hypothetical protein
MLKVRENIIFITGLILVLLIWVGTPASSSGESVMICEATEMQTSDGSSGCLSIHDDACEDEQLNNSIFCSSLTDPAVYFSDTQNQRIIFQPCLIPWEPPRI